MAAVVLLVLGWRGRRVNDHPLCRRCGFDLFGRPAGSTVCSECGADLSRRRAIRVGARRRLRGVVAASLLLLVPSVACVGVLVWPEIAAVSFAHRKPVWLLLNEAGSPDPVARDGAFNELFLRYRAGRLTDAQVAQVVGRAMEVQADARRTWLAQWGDFVEEAYRGGKVSADTWRRYVVQAPRSELIAPERFRRGERAWIELVERQTRVGSKCDVVLRVHRKLTITDAEGQTFSRDFGWVNYTVGGGSSLRGGWSLPLNEGTIGRLADGPHRATLEVVVEAHEPAGRLRSRVPIATTRVNFTTSWTVEPGTAPDEGVAMSRK